MGLETAIPWGPVGGVAQPTNHQLFSGIPAIGESYRHELAHMVLLPLMGNTSYLVSEGVPTWLGGTTGADFRTAARGLATFLAEHPAVTLDSILSGHFREQYYPAGAVFVQMVYERGGMEAVKGLYAAGAGKEFEANMERLFARSWPAIVADWRRRALAYGFPWGFVVFCSFACTRRERDRSR